MPSLLDPDQTTPDAGAGLLGIGRPQIAPPDPGVVSQADALAQTYQAITAEIARQQQISADRGLWSGGGLLEGGHPTGEGVTDAAQQVAQSLLLGTTAPGGKGFTAYHGSPHSFDAFDLGKIGTVEGAQAYGHGLYFAENEGVARGYRDDLSKGSVVMPSGEAVVPQWDDPAYNAVRLLNESGGDFAKARAKAMSGAAQHTPDDWTRDIVGVLDDYERRGIRPAENPGHMYEVNINAPPEHFLDWDAPLSEQSQHVQDALEKTGQMNDARRYFQANARMFPNPTGEDLHDYLKLANASDRAPVDMFHAAGIPGIRYLDAGSRGVGEGTRNTVIFDPATIEILRKYGIAGLMAGGAGAAATQQPSQ